MNVVLDPALLFITDDEWNDETSHDEFIEQLLNFLDYINTHDEIQIYWNDALELSLWENELLPWRQDKDFYNHAVSTINHKLHANLEFLNGEFIPADCFPNFEFKFTNFAILTDFLSLMHEIIHLNTNVYLCVHKKNAHEYTFTCKCNHHALTPRLVHTVKDFSSTEEVIRRYWDTLTPESFYTMINEVHNEYYLSTSKYLLSFNVADSFIKDIKKETRLYVQRKIVEQIIKKLTYTFKEAQDDPTLQDENIGEKTGRFRVSSRPTSRRIHYTFEKANITLINYFPEGKHNIGISHTK